LEHPEDEETYQKLLTEWTDTMLGISRLNTDLFKLKLEDFHLKVKTFQVDSKAFVACHHFNKPP
jgi:hypothetical protein